MVFEEREELYLDLSKKELQDLCRTHNLPSHSRKAQLAKLLVDHFNKRTTPSKSKRARRRLRVPSSEKAKEVDGGGGDPHTFGKMEGDVCKGKGDCVEGNVAAVDGVVNNSQQRREGKDGSDCRGNWQDSFAVGNLPPVGRRNVNWNEISSRSGLESSREVFLDTPASFQFFVRAEEGISLHVDLNSKPSNWVKRLNDEVSINHKVHRKPWSICHELGDVGTKDVDVSAEGSIRMSRSIDEPPMGRFDEYKESTKSSLTSIVPDKVADETMKFISGRNQPSSSNAISSRVGCCNHPIDPNCSLLALPCHKDLDKDSVQCGVSPSSGHSLNQSNSNDPHRGNAVTFSEAKPSSNVNLLICRNAELDTTDKSLISMCEANNVGSKTCRYGNVRMSEDIQMNQGSGSVGAISWETEVPEESMRLSQQHPEKLISESRAYIVNPDAGERTGNLPQEFICGSLGSSNSENMITVPSEEQSNNPCVKKKVGSGDSEQNNSKGNSRKRNTQSHIFEHKRKCASVKPIEQSTINLRSRKTLARGPAYATAYPRRSMRLISK